MCDNSLFAQRRPSGGAAVAPLTFLSILFPLPIVIYQHLQHCHVLGAYHCTSTRVDRIFVAPKNFSPSRSNFRFIHIRGQSNSFSQASSRFLQTGTRSNPDPPRGILAYPSYLYVAPKFQRKFLPELRRLQHCWRKMATIALPRIMPGHTGSSSPPQSLTPTLSLDHINTSAACPIPIPNKHLPGHYIPFIKL